MAVDQADLLVRLEASTGAFNAQMKGAETQVNRSAAAMARGLGRVNAANDNLVRTSGRATRSSRQFSTGMNNLSLQMQDVVVQLGAGTNAFQVLAQQGGQIAAGFGPAFGPAGFLIAGVGAAAFVISGLVGDTENLETAVDAADKALDALNDTMAGGAKSADEYTEALRRAGEELRTLERLSIGRALRQAEEAQRGLRAEAEELVRPLAERRALVERGLAERQAAGVPNTPDQQAFADRLDAFDRFLAGGSLTDLAVELDAIAARAGVTDENFRVLADQIVEPAKSSQELTDKMERLNAALKVLSGTATTAERQLLDEGGGGGVRGAPRPAHSPFVGGRPTVDMTVSGAPRPAFRPAAFRGMTREQFEQQFDDRPTVPGAPRPAQRPAEFQGMTRADFDEQFENSFDDMRSLGEALEDAGVNADSLGDSIGRALSDGIQQAENFGTVLRNVFITTLSDIAGDFLGRGIRGLLNFPIPGFAHGGNPPVGRLALVGENGPELIVPRTPTTVIPNHMLGSMGAAGNTFVVEQHINFTGDVNERARAEVLNLLPAIVEHTKSAVADTISRDPRYSAAIRGR